MISKAIELVTQFVCGLSGHDELLNFESARLSMRCTTCGHQTPGWEIHERRPQAASQTQAGA